jgi:hypothetical protein
MVAKPADPQNGKITSLEKENKEMKEELEYISQGRKISDVISSVLWAVFVYLASTCLYSLAKIGIKAIALENPTDLLGISLVTVIMAVSYLLIIIYVLIMTINTIVNTCQDDFRQFGTRINIFFSGGMKALNETPVEHAEGDPKPEPPTPAASSQKSILSPP